MGRILLRHQGSDRFRHRRRVDHSITWYACPFDELTPPLLTCDAVIAESCYLLRDLRGGGAAVMQMIERRQIESPFRVGDEAASVRKLLDKYAALPMDLADACLVRMTEQYSNPRVLTLDGDSRLYRRHGRQAISLIIPESR